MKTPFLDYWANRKERGEILESRHKIKLTTAQLSTLIGDNDVRAALQKTRVASLLPPVGTEVFRRFTPTSLEQIKKCTDSKKKELAEEDNCLKPAPELESGKPLPFFYGAPPPELRNTPLEDPDPFYQSQKTFVVVDRENTLSRFNAESSCFHFSPFSLFRRGAIKILNHKLFTALVCVALVVNLWFLVPTPNYTLYFIIELVFLSIYTLEAMLKILSRGFLWGPFTYIRDSWNRLDFVIVTTGFAFFTIEQLWFFKALRILKILGLFPATRRVAKMFGHLLNRLWDVFLLTLLVLTVFSITGTCLFAGSLRNKCVISAWESSNFSDIFDSDSDSASGYFDYKGYINDPSHQYFLQGNMDPLVCGNSSTSSVCPEGYVCLRTHSNPNYGYTNFDNFGYSFLSTLRLMLRDFWENLEHLVMQAEGKSMMIYIVLVWFFCTFSFTVFIVAAFFINFAEQTEQQINDVKHDKKVLDKILAAIKDKIEEELPEKKDAEQISCWRRMCSWDCCDCWVRLKKSLQVVVHDPFFDLAIIILLIVNICLLATEHYPMTEMFEETLSMAHLVFTIIFFLEVVVKILAMGPYEFFEVNWHYFDTIIAFLTVFELGVADMEGYSILRVIRALRLFRLARWWPGFLKWMRLAWAGLCSLWFISVVLVTLFFTFFGQLMFSRGYEHQVCKIAVDCELPRWHFHSVFHSFMVVTRALFGEWIETMWDCLQTNGGICVVYYITLLIVGNFLIFTWFLTLLMKWINDQLAPKDVEKLKASRTRFVQLLKKCGLNAGGKAKEEDSAAVEGTDCVALSNVASENGTQSSTLPIGEAQNFQKMKESEEAKEDPEDCCCQKCYSCCPSLNLDKSQGCGRVWANIRRAAFKILQHPYFNNVIFFFILLSSFALVLNHDYLYTNPTLHNFIGVFQDLVMYLFILEMLFKWIGLGFKRYFTDGWCWLEFIVVLGCILSVVSEPFFLHPVLYSLRSLIPLRILRHIRRTRRSVCGLMKMVPSLIDVILVGLTVWLFFAIIFIDMYAGKFFHCLNETSDEYFHAEEVHNKTECVMLINYNYTEVRWKNVRVNFDDSTNAYVSLFQLATLKGWIDILYAMEDAGMIEDQPEYEQSVYRYLGIPLFLLFGGFFFLIHIIKVLFDAYTAQTKKMGGSHLFLTEKQMENFNNISFRSKRPLAPCPRPQGRLIGRLFDLVSREAFEWVMQGVIWFGVVLLMIYRNDISIEEEEVHYWLSFALIVIFLLEFILKICAFRRSYFRDNLNTIDFVVLLLQIINLFLSDLAYYYIFGLCILNLLRLGRVSRIIHRFPGALRLRLLFAAWSKSLRALFNLALVLFVLMFTYASFGMFYFSRLKREAFITEIMNFETFGSSLICMFTITTWGGWDGLIIPALHYPPDCDPGSEFGGSDCGNPPLALAFYLSYLCLSSFVVLMMVLVVLVDMLNVFGQMRCDPLSQLNLLSFFKTWKKFAPDSSHSIQRCQLPDLCDKLKKPLRIPKATELDLDLSPGEEVHCRDLLLALSVQALGDCADKDVLKATIDEKYQEFMPNNPSSEQSCEMTTLQMDPEEAATPVTEEIEE